MNTMKYKWEWHNYTLFLLNYIRKGNCTYPWPITKNLSHKRCIFYCSWTEKKLPPPFPSKLKVSYTVDSLRVCSSADISQCFPDRSSFSKDVGLWADACSHQSLQSASFRLTAPIHSQHMRAQRIPVSLRRAACASRANGNRQQLVRDKVNHKIWSMAVTK